MSEIEELRNRITAWDQVPGLIVAMMSPNEHKRFTQIYEHSQKRLAELEVEENRKGSKMKWTYEGDGEWSMPSVYHDGGLSFHWRIGVCEDGTFCVSGSDPELTRCRETLPTLAEAKLFCESIEQQIREPGSRCNLELPLDAAAAQARIAELEAELSRRPVVWQLRDRKSGNIRLVGEFGRKYAAIYSNAEIEYLKTLSGWVAFANDYAIEPYTGEQS